MTLKLTDAEVAEVFGNSDPRVHQPEAEARWGNTDAYKESARRTSLYSKADWQRIQDEADAVVQEFVSALNAGLSANSVEALAAAEAHRQHISQWYYECTYEIHTGLADMYVADERFTAHYEKYASGLAQFVSDAIHANAIANS